MIGTQIALGRVLFTVTEAAWGWGRVRTPHLTFKGLGQAYMEPPLLHRSYSLLGTYRAFRHYLTNPHSFQGKEQMPLSPVYRWSPEM